MRRLWSNYLGRIGGRIAFHLSLTKWCFSVWEEYPDELAGLFVRSAHRTWDEDGNQQGGTYLYSNTRWNCEINGQLDGTDKSVTLRTDALVITWKSAKDTSFFFFKFICLFIYFWLCWVFVSVRGLSPVVASGGHSSSRCTGLSLSRPLLLRSTGSRRAGSVVVAHRPSCSAACGIFPDQGSNLCPLHWQADS